jgi:thiol:disulfide interchange protein DsbD
MFGVYEFRVPARLANLAGSSSGRQGFLGAFGTGLTVGVVAAPCIGPLVLALLTFVGESGDAVLGFAMFFTLAIGLGLPFLFLAVISGSISKLPKSGEWMEWVKKLFGMILIGMAVFFLQPLISEQLYFVLMGIVFIVGGIVVGFLAKTTTSALFFNVLKRFVGVAAPIFGLWLIFMPGHVIAPESDHKGIIWNAYDDDLLIAAKEKEQFVVIDFTAEWCLPCKELDHLTFSPPEVVQATTDFMRLRADLTQSGSEEVALLRKVFAIRGVPTVVFLDKNGKERKDLRVFGFVDKDDFLARIDKLRNGKT